MAYEEFLKDPEVRRAIEHADSELAWQDTSPTRILENLIKRVLDRWNFEAL